MESATCLDSRWLKGYLQTLQELVAEVEGAIAAVAANALARFQQHITHQQALVLRLQELANLASMVGGPGWLTTVDGDHSGLREGIRAGHRKLADKNRHYAGLIRRAVRTQDLILAGCQIYSSDYRPPQFQPEHHSLSCEI